jgi:hypothetical protein
VQVEPVGLSVQAFALQMFGATQSELTVQPMRQTGAVASQVYRPQDVVVAAAQTPAPLHSRADVAVEPVQLGAAHCVPLTCLRHAPAPSQVPSFPQVDAAAAVHCAATSGGSPGAIGEQVPTLPASVHDIHVPVQAALQQTLFTQ